MLVSHFMITYLPAIGKLKGSFPLPAHWEGGARANIEIIAAKISVRPRNGMAEGGRGEW